jgi:hypothetical protein
LHSEDGNSAAAFEISSWKRTTKGNIAPEVFATNGVSRAATNGFIAGETGSARCAGLSRACRSRLD